MTSAIETNHHRSLRTNQILGDLVMAPQCSVRAIFAPGERLPASKAVDALRRMDNLLNENHMLAVRVQARRHQAGG